MERHQAPFRMTYPWKLFKIHLVGNLQRIALQYTIFAFTFWSLRPLRWPILAYFLPGSFSTPCIRTDGQESYECVIIKVVLPHAHNIGSNLFFRTFGFLVGATQVLFETTRHQLICLLSL